MKRVIPFIATVGIGVALLVGRSLVAKDESTTAGNADKAAAPSIDQSDTAHSADKAAIEAASQAFAKAFETGD